MCGRVGASDTLVDLEYLSYQQNASQKKKKKKKNNVKGKGNEMKERPASSYIENPPRSPPRTSSREIFAYG